MAREYKKETKTQVYESNVLVKKTCDLCGKESKNDDWSNSFYDIDKTDLEATITYESGCSYPEGGNTETIFFDICPRCFLDKLVPWMESQGVKPQKQEKDW